MIKISRAVAAAVLALGAGSGTWAAASASAATVRTTVPSSSTGSSINTGSSSTQWPSRIRRCTTSQLDVWVNPATVNGTAGTIYYHLDFTNTSHKECYLYGSPGVSATNWSGKTLGFPALPTADVPARSVKIRPRGTAHAVLGYVDGQISLTCLPSVATYLKVYPPGSKESRKVSFPMAVCTTKAADLTIGRAQPGA